MRPHEILNTTTDSRTYRLIRRLIFTRCSYCPPHGGQDNSKGQSYYHARSYSHNKVRYLPRVA